MLTVKMESDIKLYLYTSRQPLGESFVHNILKLYKEEGQSFTNHFRQ